jgi:hypothetical protein
MATFDSTDRGSPCTACGKMSANTSEIKITRHRALDIRKVNYGIPQARGGKRVTEGKAGITFSRDDICDDCVVAVRNYFELVWEAKRNGR